MGSEVGVEAVRNPLTLSMKFLTLALYHCVWDLGTIIPSFLLKLVKKWRGAQEGEDGFAWKREREGLVLVENFNVPW